MSVGVVNFNNGNQSDLLVVNCGTNNVLVLTDYWIKPSVRITTYNTIILGERPTAVGDLNNDHIPDIVTAMQEKMCILNDLEDGTFDERSISVISIPTM